MRALSGCGSRAPLWFQWGVSSLVLVRGLLCSCGGLLSSFGGGVTSLAAVCGGVSSLAAVCGGLPVVASPVAVWALGTYMGSRSRGDGLSRSTHPTRG